MGFIEDKHSTDVESTPPPPYTPRICQSGDSLRTSTRLTLHRFLFLCIRRASVCVFSLKVSHALISDICLFSMTLLRGVG